MTRAIQMLFDEHDVIANAINAGKHARTYLGKSKKAYEQTIRDLISFFRSYADNFHHQKEEDILFPEMKRKNELLGQGILKEMNENHEDFREMIRDIERFLDAREYEKAQEQLERYGHALLDHIAVENEEVFQMAETLFTEDELDKIMGRFEDCDIETGTLQKQELAEMAEEIRKNLQGAH